MGQKQNKRKMQLTCAGQPRMSHNPLERGDTDKAGRGNGAFLRLTESQDPLSLDDSTP